MSRIWKFLLSFTLFAALCFAGLLWFVNHEVAKGVDQAIADVGGLELSYGDLSVDITDQSVTLRNVDATLPQGQHVTAETVRVSSYDQRNPVPHFLIAEATGVVVDTTPANFGDLAGALNVMGISQFAGDISLDYHYSPETKLMTLNSLVFRDASLGDCKLSGSLDGLDLNNIRLENLIGLRISTADLAFTDHALVDTLLRNAAHTLATSEQNARSRIIAEISSMADYARQGGNYIAEDALLGLNRFVEKPETITISVRPTEPVPVLFFFMGRDFYDNLQLMNVIVSTDSHEEI